MKRFTRTSLLDLISCGFTDRGYELKTSFLLFHKTINFFSAENLNWIRPGAGMQAGSADGL